MPAVSPRQKTGSFVFDAFDGGLNLRDAPGELDMSDSPDCMNITLDERGGAVARTGLLKLNAASLLPAAPSFMYYSAVADALLAYISTHSAAGRLYKSTNAGTTWTEVTWTPGPPQFTQGAQAAITDFKDRVVVVNTLDGVYSFPSNLGLPVRTVGGTGNMDEVRGSSIAVWQNKCWVTGDPREDATHSRARVWFSNAGNEQLWTVATAFVDIRDIDTLPTTAIGAGQGMDVTGKPTLVVYKAQSVHRINDSTTGSYTTLHAKGAGAVSNKAVASNLGRICSINQGGVWVTDGLAVPVRVSDKIEPLFTSDSLNFAAVTNWSAAPYRDRIVFTIARAGSATNNLALEYHPAIGWIVPHKYNAGPMATYTKETFKLMSASSTSGAVYETFKGGTDDGVSIPARYQTPWIDPGKGDEVRLRALRMWGRGSPSVQVRTDFALAGDQYALGFEGGGGFNWGTGVWGTDTWGESVYESAVTGPLDQVCKYVSLALQANTSNVSFRLPLLGDGVSQETGAWAIYGAKLDHVLLGT